MHFLGAVITERKEDLEDVLAPWSEYNDVPEHVSKTRGEFLAECRSLDRAEVRLGGGLDSPEGRSLVRQARERLALGDKDALKAYAEYNGVTLNAYGDVLSTFNEDSFYELLGARRRMGDARRPDAQGASGKDLRRDTRHARRPPQRGVRHRRGRHTRRRTVQRLIGGSRQSYVRKPPARQGLVGQLPRLTDNTDAAPLWGAAP